MLRLIWARFRRLCHQWYRMLIRFEWLHPDHRGIDVKASDGSHHVLCACGRTFCPNCPPGDCLLRILYGQPPS